MKTILVAEDRDTSRELICTVLSAAGYNLIEARDGQEAVERADETLVDLVLLDLYMPHLDGFAVLERLRARPGYASVPIIALTASAMAGDRERAIACGFSDYISKPVNMASLRREIARLLGSEAPGLVAEKEQHDH
jgi:two-component system sensor histidine kinase/response regulator